MQYERRCEALRARLQDLGADTFLVTNGTNVRYLSGFDGSNGTLLITPNDQVIITDFRYLEQVAQQAPDFYLVRQDGPLHEAITKAVADLGSRRIAFEANHLTVAAYRALRSALPAEITLLPTEDIILELRAVKEAEEIACLQRAQAITDEAFERWVPLVQEGVSEAELAWKLEVILRELGAEKPSFDIIVAIGDHSALPHYRPSPGERRLQTNEIVLVDFGAVVDGYHADMTRTLFIGEPDERFRTVYAAVLEALHRAEAGIRAGMSGHEADALARAFLTAEGFGDAFGHSLGHGVGLEVHELPRLSPKTSPEKLLPEGSVVTIEPGVYLPGWGGVRIEDLAIVRTDGVEVLTRSPKAVDSWLVYHGIH